MAKKAQAQSGYVYLIYCPDNDLYKIGCTEDCMRRFDQIKRSIPFLTKLLHTIETNDIRASEKALHKQFAIRRRVGEWFALDSLDTEWICSIQSMSGNNVCAFAPEAYSIELTPINKF